MPKKRKFLAAFIVAAVILLSGLSQVLAEETKDSLELHINGVYYGEIDVQLSSDDELGLYVALEDILEAMGLMDGFELSANVPLSLIENIFDADCSWNESWTYEDANEETIEYPGKVTIYTRRPMPLVWENISVICERVFEEIEFEPDGNDYLVPPTLSYSFKVPMFEIPDDPYLQEIINQIMYDFYDTSMSWLYEVYLEQMASDEKYTYSDSFTYKILTTSGRNNILTVIFEGYEYSGGVHGMPYTTAYSFDIDKSEVFKLNMLFAEGVEYTDILLEEISKIHEAGSDGEYENVEIPSYLPSEGNDFYIENGSLVFFYHPYELAAYARGFVEYRIQLDDIREHFAKTYVNIK